MKTYQVEGSNKFRITKFIYSVLCCIVLCVLLEGCGKVNGQDTSRTADIAVLYTGDVHCAIDENIGYAGLAAYKEQLASEGCEVILVDSGDAIQGGMMGSYSKGESIIEIMNEVGYSAMTLGNHEFDYNGVQNVNTLSALADFPFLSSNFVNKETEKTTYTPYVMEERDGVKIAFVGVSTPKTITSGTPRFFMNEKEEFVYDFLGDNTGTLLWEKVQKTVDAARQEGADYVIALTHLGIDEEIYSSRNLIANTSGIDAVLDGHSHSIIECERVTNKNGERILLSATGTKLKNIGFLLLDKKGNLSTGLVSEVAERDEKIVAFMEQLQDEYENEMKKVVAHSEQVLIANEPETDVRLVRMLETNLGDLCADAYRTAADADVAFANGGGIRASLPAGDITYGQIMEIHPFGNLLCKVEVSGQTILDALEFGAKFLPEESGGFLQVSGLTYEINTALPSTVEVDENGMFVSVQGQYRVQNVLIDGKPIQLTQKYSVVSNSYMLKNFGDGFTMFADAEMLMDEFILDAEAVITYFENEYEKNKNKYDEFYGEGRIKILASPME